MVEAMYSKVLMTLAALALQRFAFDSNHPDRRTRLFHKPSLAGQGDALPQVKRKPL